MKVLIGIFHELSSANSSLDEALPKKMKYLPGSYHLIYASKAKNLDLCQFKALVLQLIIAGMMVLKEYGSMDKKVCSTFNLDVIRLYY